MFIRQITYLIALAKTEHFGRAAQSCNVSQPALSSAIQHLEEELGVTIIQRGQRFQKFTPEGERLLMWAQRLVADWESMKEEAFRFNNLLSGVLRIGVIPTTTSVLPLITGPYQAAHSGVHLKLLSLSGEEIARQLDAFELDLGITYLEYPGLQGFRILPLYRERYVLLTRSTGEFSPDKALSWSEIAALPLCLLDGSMQNRRIINAAFRDAGVTPNVVVETNSVFALYSQVRCAGLYSIVPHSLLSLFEMRQEVTAIPLSPELSRQIGLIAPKNHLLPPVLEEFWSVTQALDLQTRFDKLITGVYEQIHLNN
ncbi:LysR family transcriptional regulator [Methylobacillus caricis]|uniref:LysR family transcriptional regulator n=1 Tax=Methylobacillus caricis TaxID=1971611 RepID=UPI001CFFBCD1|nr:LysR family transcriptional regulator [Methylobacillus caricis]MCB5187908.1 LysR family transcriptional regulator [Methylobacillus caricis]